MREADVHSEDAPELELYRKVRRLRLKALRPVRTHLTGAYASAFHGPGMAFEELRHYEPGDDVRHIDWHVLARFGEAFVRRYIEERQLRLMLVVDVSASMQFASGARTKREAALETAAVLALSAAAGGDKVGAVLLGAGRVRTVPPQSGERHALRVLRDAVGARPERVRTDVRGALRLLANLRPHGIVFLISDMQFDPPLWDEEVRRMLAREARRHELVAVSVLDPAENDPARGVILEGVDPESGAANRTDLYGTRSRETAQRLASERRRTQEVLAALGVETVSVDTDGDPVLALRRLFRRREGRRR